MTTPASRGPDALVAWAAQQRKVRPCRFAARVAGLRFAFYGRISTSDYQDRASSRRWQRHCADELVADRGEVVVSFFDEGVSRRVPWPDRPQAGALLAALADPARGFDAVVVGEYERAFQGEQLRQLAPILRRHAVELWLPEVYGPVDFDNPRHLAVVDLLGVRSGREVSRARFRTTAAMRAQVSLQGRHLGGRPPYGYLLVDAGPHPNRAHASWGRRLHRLEPDPTTAPHVRWMFAQRLTGRSVASIARELNDNGVTCPSGADRDRNPHRRGDSWIPTTVAAILSNPRYTGRQVWNRQPTAQDAVEPVDGVARLRQVQRRGQADGWVISDKPAHPPLVSEEDFVAVQAIHAAPVPADGTTRRYVLAGLVCCGVCGRLMDSHWVHRRATYRCRHGYNSARSKPATRPKILYVREDHLLARIRQCRQLLQQRPELAVAEPETVADYLGANNMIIVCDHDTWVVETDTATIPLAAAAGLLLTSTAKIPAQRNGDRQERDQPSRSVWN